MMALAMPKASRALPSGVTESMNGAVPDRFLAEVGDGRGKLLTGFALAMRVLHDMARKAGIHLTTTGRGRSIPQQISLFKSRYEPCSFLQYLEARAFRRGKIWDNKWNNTGRRYWRKRRLAGGYPATAAEPGTSNHGLNSADDLAEVVNGRLVALRSSTVQWLYANAPKCCIFWETSEEPWHVHPSCSTPNSFVRNYKLPGSPLPVPGPQPEPDPVPIPDLNPPEDDDMPGAKRYLARNKNNRFELRAGHGVIAVVYRGNEYKVLEAWLQAGGLEEGTYYRPMTRGIDRPGEPILSIADVPELDETQLDRDVGYPAYEITLADEG